MNFIHAVKSMDKQNKKFLGISLIVSAITMLFTLLVAPKDKKGARILAFIAFLEGMAGLLVAVDEPRRLIRRRSADVEIDEGELFDEDEALDADSVLHAEGARENEGEGAPSLCCDVPCDDEATEADFM